MTVSSVAASSSGAAQLSDTEFRTIIALASEVAGLAIPDTKKALVQSRISKRMRQLGLSEFADYIALLTKGDAEEHRAFLSALTTNVSSFYRESHHFEFFGKTVLPKARAKLQSGESVRIWSAGCSSGQEPYTIAMELLAAIPEATAPATLILGTDIDPDILDRARAGVYSALELAGVPSDKTGKHLTEQPNATFAITDRVKSLIRFKELNLHGPWPMSGPFDAIFCRNVMIYFDETRQQALWPRFRDMLVPGGYLFLGHSERIHPLQGSGFTGAGVTIYQKT